MNITRRTFLQGMSASILLLPISCRRPFTRSAESIDLGRIEDLLLPLQLNTAKSMFVTLDEAGWAAMSSRCSYEGCGLTLHGEFLLCSCCRSVFDLNGIVTKGPASASLPWFEIEFENGHLYADSGKIVGQSYRFMNPKIKDSIKELLALVKERGVSDPPKVPAVLLGDDSETPGPMFVEPGEHAELESAFEKLKRK